MHNKSHDEVIWYVVIMGDDIYQCCKVGFVVAVGLHISMCWFVQHDSKWRHMSFSQRLQRLQNRRGVIHGWDTTFRCLTETDFLDNFTYLVCLECIVMHILDHTYISYSILSTPTKLI